MTIDEFWKKHNRCPLCVNYTYQGFRCFSCKLSYPGAEGHDRFEPTDKAIKTMNKEVTKV